ncbi:Conserved_hypothetical protein [Hexamita inflata]|uniref:Uncharacterized protein n=1 Tax=Hexamita inflata TaxID=28002 RepID=A0ABP1KJF1_9EUKA
MLCFATSLLIALKPSEIYNFTCTSLDSIANFELKHENKEYYFSLAVESLDGTKWYGSVTDSTNKSKMLPLNNRIDLNDMAVGTVKVQFQCTNLGTVNQQVSISYTNSRLLLQNQQFNTGFNKDTYFMIPICHDNMDIHISTDSLIYASFSNERVNETTAEFGNAHNFQSFIIPEDKVKVPGYLYLYFSLRGVPAYVLVSQKNMSSPVPYNVEQRSSLSAQMHCYDNYITPLHAGDHFVAVSAVNDNFTVPAILLISNYSNNIKVPTYTTFDFKSEAYDYYLDINPADYPDAYINNQSIVGVSLGQTAWLPVTHSLKQNYTHYMYSIYFTVNNSFTQEGISQKININGGSDVQNSVLLVRQNDQYTFDDHQIPSANLVVRIEGEDLVTQYQKLSIGFGQPNSDVGTVTKISDTVYEAILTADEVSANVQQGELFYTRIQRNKKVGAFATILNFQKQYKLQEGVTGKFNRLDGQDCDYFSAFFDPSAGKGLKMKFTNISSKKLTVFWSQSSVMPIYNNESHKIVCNGSQSCTANIFSYQVDPKLPIYLNFQTNSSFTINSSHLNYIANLAPLEKAAKNNEWYGIDHDCVALVQPWILKTTNQWQRGMKVQGNSILQGTCIASFQYSQSKGYFYDGKLGGHTAVFISQDSYGITVYDQWNIQPCHTRVIRFKNDGSKQNDGNEFYVIE